MLNSRFKDRFLPQDILREASVVRENLLRKAIDGGYEMAHQSESVEG